MGDKDDDSLVGAFEDGHWAWDDKQKSLVFVFNHPQKDDKSVVLIKPGLVVATVEFRELDLLEQLRYRKRYQRRVLPGQKEVIALQDIKDFVIYTAPQSILSQAIVLMLHIPTADRFLRALILYCQYYLQILVELAERMAALETKIRTQATEEVEELFKEDLSDLRCLVAKEYAVVLFGGDDTKKFHHMGPLKKKKSLANKDARLIESFVRMSIQIVWIALGRRSFNHLELEINRMFKTDLFNSAEHRLKTKYMTKMSKEERNVLLGKCLPHQSKNYLRSPLINEIMCARRIVDYRTLGLGVVKYKQLPNRMGYMLAALTCPEEELKEAGVVVGILGKSRNIFDTCLHLLPTSALEGKSSKSQPRQGTSSQSSRKSTTVTTKSSDRSLKKTNTLKLYGYENVILPEKSPGDPPFPQSFPSEGYPVRHCDATQKMMWLNRVCRLASNSGRKSRISMVE